MWRRVKTSESDIGFLICSTRPVSFSGFGGSPSYYTACGIVSFIVLILLTTDSGVSKISIITLVCP